MLRIPLSTWLKKMIDSNEDITAALGQFFETTFIEETLDHIPELPERTMCKLPDITITEQSVLSGLLRLNSTKPQVLTKFILVY